MRRAAVGQALLWCLLLPSLVQAQSQCVRCHRAYVRREYLAITAQWERSAHAAAGVDCSDCHGGNPRLAPRDESEWRLAMQAVPGFRGRFRREEIPQLCARCHSDPARMRPYNLRTDQYDQYLQSRHGKALRAGDPKVAICTDCHGVGGKSHEIRAKDDPKSSAFKTNVPATCGRCHADEDYMKGYRDAAGRPLLTNQLADYKSSVHGEKLLKEQERAAPSCADCHGTHGATPPQVTEVAAVCGTCHAQTQEYFQKGPHAEAVRKEGRPRCVDCHGTHRISWPKDKMLLDGRQGTCGACHPAGTRANQVAKEIHAQLDDAQGGLDRCRRLLDRAERAHMDVAAARAELEEANTALLEARAWQHTVIVSDVRARAGAAGDFIRKAEAGGRQALAQSRRRRLTLVLALGLCLFAAFSLVVKVRQFQTREASAGTELTGHQER